MVMDYIAGEELWERLQRQGKLSEQEILDLLGGVFDALEYLHSQNPPIFHRDIKPQNIRITPEGRTFLVDFGIAKVGGGTTTTSSRAATPPFTPPEQYRMAGETDDKSDQYALAMTIYVALTGKVPTHAEAPLREQAVALDTSGEALRKGLEAIPTLVKPNRQELAEAFGEGMDTDEQIVKAIARLLASGVRYAVVSLGAEGAIGGSEEGIWKAVPPSVSVVNTVGSGDALLGGLLHALLTKKLRFEDALAFAVAAGTANTLVDGPGYVDAETVQALWSQVHLRRL
jgi:serine/threonine protein kinase